MRSHICPASRRATRRPLLARRISLFGRSDHEVVAAFATLGSVQRPATLRQLSTRTFWGHSKILDGRAELLATLFPNLPVRERPIVVAVHVPTSIEGVLFIENQDNYSAVIDGEPDASRNLAAVYLSGFRGTATRIRNRHGAHLHFGGPGIERREAIAKWWFNESELAPLYFWGDLDFSSMQMLKSLRQRFGNVEAWRPGYEPMLAELTATSGNNVRDYGQVDPGVTGCAFADEILLPAVRALGWWDQERIAD